MKITKKQIAKYAFVGVINSLAVYGVYTPYVFLWVHYSLPQYFRWLVGGIPMSLGFGWLFSLIVVKTAKWFDHRVALKGALPPVREDPGTPLIKQ